MSDDEHQEEYTSEEVALIHAKGTFIGQTVNGMRTDMILEILTALLASILATAPNQEVASTTMAEFIATTMMKAHMAQEMMGGPDRTLN